MDINLGGLPFDVDFHPSDSLVATGLINGYLLLYRYAAEAEPHRLLKVRAHKKSCRATRFINEGRAIVTGSPDCSILATDVETGAKIAHLQNAHTLLKVRAHKKSCRATRFINEGRAIVTGSPDCSILATDVETGAKIAHLQNAHTAAVNRIINLTEATIASGDDLGCVKLWDTRQQSCCHTFQVHEEYISDMTFASDSMRLLATSGDGTLSVCSIRSNKVQAQSEFCEDEPLSVVIMKNGRKVICGTQTGTLLLYSWGFFKDCSDRFVDLSPNAVDALLKYDEDRLITGSSNGLISLVGILPNRIIQPIAEHSEYPVERLAFSHDKKLLGSISHDNMLKLWDMDELLQGPSTVTRNDTAASDSDSDSDSDGMDVDSDLANASRGTKRKNTGTGNGQASSSSFGSFFEGL